MSELMSRLGGQNLAFYPQVAMVIFITVFFAVTIRLWLKSRGEAKCAEYARAASLPLEDAATLANPAHTLMEAKS